MSRSLLHDWECDIERCCRENDLTEMISIAEDIYNTAHARGKNHSDVTEVLDKIKAEVLEYIDDLDIAAEICNIFDKYKAESE